MGAKPVEVYTAFVVTGIAVGLVYAGYKAYQVYVANIGTINAVGSAATQASGILGQFSGVESSIKNALGF